QEITNDQGDKIGDPKYFNYLIKKSTNQFSEPVAEPINHNLVYTRTAPTVLTQGPDGVVYGRAKDGIRLVNIDGRMRVAGDRKKDYVDFATGNAVGMAFDKDSGDLAFRKAKEGISLAETLLDTDIDTEIALAYGAWKVFDTGETVTVEEAKEYTVLKRARDGKLRFGTRPSDELLKSRKIYSVFNTQEESIEFLKGEELSGENPIVHRRTVTFDVDANNTALVVFQDDQDLYRLRMASLGPNNKLEVPVKLGGENVLTDEGNKQANRFKELSIYRAQDSKDQASGYALLLDSQENAIWQIEYYVQMVSPFKNHILKDTLPNDNSTLIPVGTTPIDMVLSKDSKKAYVLNQGDKTISILSLFDGDKTLSVEDIKKNTQTISLKDYLGEKNIDLVPTSLAYRDTDKGDYLLVGSEGINGAIVIDLKTIPAARVPSPPAGGEGEGEGGEVLPREPVADEPQPRPVAARPIVVPEEPVDEEEPLEEEEPVADPIEEDEGGVF
ncbi:MAG: hypothetical protein Q8O68_01100, partial [Candidatus Daviesbacteria bacterium]|nr:hypothetical protein [Candidatus Daviesbacteria bacterium]